MAAIIAIIAARLKSLLRNAAIVSGLIVLGGLIGLCAMGYALDAAHTELDIRYGTVSASLILSGGLLSGGNFECCDSDGVALENGEQATCQ